MNDEKSAFIKLMNIGRRGKQVHLVTHPVYEDRNAGDFLPLGSHLTYDGVTVKNFIQFGPHLVFEDHNGEGFHSIWFPFGL